VKFARIGMISGVQAEIDAFAPELVRDTERVGALAVQRIVFEGRDVVMVCAGIGKVAAATAASLLRLRYDADLLMVIGTAGWIGDGHGGLFLVEDAVQGDFGAQRESGLVHYTAGSWPIGPAEVRPFTPLAQTSALPRTRIATSDLFIEWGDHGERLRAKLCADMVDMETGAVAQAAELLGVPWAAIKAATDGANEDSAVSFQENLARAARAAAQAAESYIRALP
jgi:adenosylhomocysteine nucleosidase